MGESRELSTRIVLWIFYILTALFIAFIAYGVSNLLTPIAISFLLMFALSPALKYLDGKGIPRLPALIFVLLLIVFFGYLMYQFAVPYFIDEIKSILGQSDIIKQRSFVYLNDLKIYLSGNYPSLSDSEYLDAEYLSSLSASFLAEASSSAFKTLTSSLFYFILIPIITFFLLLQGGTISLHLIAMIPNRYFEMFIIILENVKRRITSYMLGLIIQMMIFIIIFSSGFYLISLPHGILVGVIAGIVNIIPYAGPVMGLIPAIAVSFLDPTGSVLFLMIIVYVFALIFDMLVTQPLVLAKSAQLHPLIALLAILTAQKLPGVEGVMIILAMVIAVPFAGIVMMIIQVMYRSLKAFRIL